MSARHGQEGKTRRSTRSSLRLCLVAVSLCACGRDQRDLASSEDQRTEAPPDEDLRPGSSSGGATSGGATSGGATSGGATSGGTGGTTVNPDDPEPSALLGYYDVHLDAFEMPSGCSWGRGSQIHLSIRENTGDQGGFWSTRMDWDFYRGSYQSNALLQNQALIFSGSSHDSTQLHLQTDKDGFTGTGTIMLTLDCPGETDVALAVPVTLTEDVTPPRVSWVPEPRLLEAVFSYSVLLPRTTERLTVSANNSTTYVLRQEEQPENFLSIRDADTGDALDHYWKTQTLGFAWGVAFQDRSSVEGRNVQLLVTGAASDEAGNQLATGEPSVMHIYSSEVISGEDTLATPPSGMHRGARYVAPGTPESPCEVDGCVLLEGRTYDPEEPPVDAQETDRPFFSVRYPGDPTRSLQARFRYLLKSDSPLPFGGLWFSEGQSGYSITGEDQTPTPTPLPVPLLGYTHATPWATTGGSFDGPAEEKGAVFFLPAFSEFEEQEVLLVIDRLIPVE